MTSQTEVVCHVTTLSLHELLSVGYIQLFTEGTQIRPGEHV